MLRHVVRRCHNLLCTLNCYRPPYFMWPSAKLNSRAFQCSFPVAASSSAQTHAALLSGPGILSKWERYDQVMENSCVHQPPLTPHPEPTPLLNLKKKYIYFNKIYYNWILNHIGSYNGRLFSIQKQ